MSMGEKLMEFLARAKSGRGPIKASSAFAKLSEAPHEAAAMVPFTGVGPHTGKKGLSKAALAALGIGGLAAAGAGGLAYDDDDEYKDMMLKKFRAMHGG